MVSNDARPSFGRSADRTSQVAVQYPPSRIGMCVPPAVQTGGSDGGCQSDSCKPRRLRSGRHLPNQSSKLKAASSLFGVFIFFPHTNSIPIRPPEEAQKNCSLLTKRIWGSGRATVSLVQPQYILNCASRFQKPRVCLWQVELLLMPSDS